jgi:two-component SAPR family response regulator
LVASESQREELAGQREDAAMSVQVKVLGGFGVLLGGVPVSSDAWGRRQAAQLVQLLALSRDRRLHREQVIDALWPGLSWEAGAPRLHKAAHYARRALGDQDAVVLRRELVSLYPTGATSRSTSASSPALPRRRCRPGTGCSRQRR